MCLAFEGQSACGGCKGGHEGIRGGPNEVHGSASTEKETAGTETLSAVPLHRSPGIVVGFGAAIDEGPSDPSEGDLVTRS